MAAGTGSAQFGATAATIAENMSAIDWLKFLEPLLNDQWTTVELFQDYYDGKQKLQMATAKFREAFSRYFPPMANNWMQIVVDAPVSRLTVQGFRFNSGAEDALATPESGRAPVSIGGQTPPWEMDADEKAWDIWQANNLDSISRMLHTDAVKLGVAYALVSPPDPKRPTGKFPRITPEHASQCFVYCDPEDRRYRLAGIKRWEGDMDGLMHCNVYLSDAVYKFTAEKPKAMQANKDSGIVLPVSYSETVKFDWQPAGKVTHDMGVVPLVPLENKPDLLYGGRSDLENALPIQDAVNKFCLDMQVSAEFHAYPQRWAAGWEQAVDDRGRELKGREVEVYLSAARMLRSENETAKFGSFAQGDVKNYLDPIEMYIDHLAAQTQTPLYYLKGKMAAMSADAMHAQDQGLVDRCNAKILGLSDGWEEVMRCAFLAQGDTKRGNATNAEALWADPESQSLAVLVQAAMVMRAELSVPIEMCWELLGWSPQKIRLARDMMNLPPGGAVMGQPVAAGGANGAMPGTPGAAEPNDPNQHPGNQAGQPSGLPAQLSGSIRLERPEVPG